MTVAHDITLLLLKINILLFGQSGSLSSRLRGITQCLMSACFHVKEKTHRQRIVHTHAVRVSRLILPTFKLVGTLCDISPRIYTLCVAEGTLVA
jgi:hypothetical protein